MMMTVDAQIQPLLDQAAAAGPPDFGRLTATDMRAGINGMLAMFNAGRPQIAGIAARDISLRTAPPLPARLYRPQALSGPSAVLVFFHGGGWVVGDLETHDVFCRRIAALVGCTVISVDYRLAPEHVFPAAVDDAVAAVEAVRARAEELAIDPGRIVIGGDSAGGSLAAVAAQTAAKAGIALAGQLLICPSTDLASPPRPGGSRERLATGYLLTDPEIRWYADQYLPAGVDRTDPRASPALGNLTGLAPAIIATAGYDPISDDGILYAEALERAGTVVDHHHFPSLVHGFNLLDAVSAEADRALREVAEAVRGLIEAVR
jgi:acetyl esterase